MYEVDKMSSLEAKFDALMTKLNQQALKEPTLGEITYKRCSHDKSSTPSRGHELCEQ